MAAFATALLTCASLDAQHLVQGVVDGLADPYMARAARVLLEQQQGVLMARFDTPTRNMMLHVEAGSAVSAELINQWLAPLDLQVRCYARRDARELPFRHLDPDRCDALPLHAR